MTVPQHPTLDTIIAAVAEFHGYAPDMLTGPSRVTGVVGARQEAMYLMRTLTDASLPQIGRALTRDHSTVLYGCRKLAQVDQRQPLRLERVRAHVRGVLESAAQ